MTNWTFLIVQIQMREKGKRVQVLKNMKGFVRAWFYLN